MFHTIRSQDCRWLVFGLELQGTDGKVAALMYLNGSTGPCLLFGFSSEIIFLFFLFFFSLYFFFFSGCALLNHFRVFPESASFFYCTFPHFCSCLCCWDYWFQTQKAWRVSSCFSKVSTYGDLLKEIYRKVPPWPLLQELGVLGSTQRRACRAQLVLFLTSISYCCCRKQRSEPDGPQTWPSDFTGTFLWSSGHRMSFY